MPHDTTSFDMHRRLSLPTDRLWQVLTDPHQRGQWNAPTSDMVVTVEHADLRVGGQERHHYSSESMSEEMPPFTAETRWYHLDGPSRAVFTETVLIEGEAMFTSLVTYVLTPAAGAEGSATDLGLTVATSSFTGSEIGSDVAMGWEAGLANLDTYVATLTEPTA
jgi:uncharacterized protein YndB with AHSA1/START domain